MRTFLLAALLIFALCTSARVADARTTSTIAVSVQVVGSCLIDPSSPTPIVCDKGTNAVVESSLLTLADVGALVAVTGTNEIGLGSAHTSWKLVTISL